MKFLVRASNLFFHRRVWRFLFFWLLLPLLGLFLLSNIILNSQWSRGRVTQALEARSGVPWELNTLNWTPNGHVHVHGLRAELGDGALAVEHVRFVPNWAQLRQKKLGFSSIVVESPSLDVSHEWLLECASSLGIEPSKTPGSTQPKSDVAEVADAKVDPALAGLDASPVPPHTDAVSAGGGDPLPATGVKPSNAASVSQEKEFYEFDARLRVINGAVRVRSAEGELVAVDGIRANVPYGGVDLEGEVFCESVKILGRTLLNEGEVQLRKKGPVLGIKETDLQLLGVEMKPVFNLIKGAHGLYFLAGLDLPEQQVNLLFKHLDLSVRVTVEDLQARMQFAGLVARPIGWRGIAGIRSKEINVREGHRGSLLHFDQSFAEAALYQGAMRMPRAEMTGEDISLLSNGVVAMNGRGFGVVRVMSSPEKKGWIDKFSKGSGIFPEARSHIMRPLHSGDLYFVDAHLDGPVFQPMVKLDQLTGWTPLWDEIARILTFVRDERSEEGDQPSD